jgi:hypothetical protein
MDTKLSISDLAEVLAAIKEITKPYQLGIQLKIDLSELKTIETSYSKDIDRQKTEVIKHWLRNSPDASWTTLANAVERMGGHARLAETLREKEENFEVQTIIGPHSHSFSLDKCVLHNILLLGKMGHGTSTLGNRILDSDGWFKINDQRCPQTAHGSSMLQSASQLKDYIIEVYDHSGLFEGAISINGLRIPSAIPEELNLVIP